MRPKVENHLTITLSAKSENESLARVIVAGFLVASSACAEDLADLKTAVSEAVTNAVVHAYRARTDGRIKLDLKLYSDCRVRIAVTDYGAGMEDVALCRTPFYTTDREHERSGMGFAIMETFSDRVRVTSRVGKGTRVILEKRLKAAECAA